MTPLRERIGAPLTTRANAVFFASLLATLAIAAAASGQSAAPPAAVLPTNASAAAPRTPDLRVGVVAREGRYQMLTPLVYWGAFTVKTAVFEPLVTCGPKGELAPGLVESWDISADGKTYTLHLRPRVVCHDGNPLDAEAVRTHLRLWAANPGHDWLGSTARILAVEAPDPLVVRVTLSHPWNLLRDVQAINPGHVAAPGSYDREGVFELGCGTGPFKLLEHRPDDSYLLARHESWWGGTPPLAHVEMVTLPLLTKLASSVRTNERIESPEMLRWLLEGRVDLVADDEGPLLPRESLAAIEQDPRFRVWVRPGSAVNYLLMNTAAGPLRDRDLRRLVARSIDRDHLVREAESGYGQPCRTLFRPGCGDWPEAAGEVAAPPATTARPAEPLVLLLQACPSERFRKRAAVLADMLEKAGIRVTVAIADDVQDFSRRVRDAQFDLLFRATHGAPYDPWIHVSGMFLRNEVRMKPGAASRALWSDDAMVRHCLAAQEAVDPEERRRAFAAAQARLDEEVPLVPLFISHRVAVSRSWLEGLEFGANGYDLGLARVRRSR